MIRYGRIRHLLPTLLHPHGASTLSSLPPQPPPPAAPAHRLRAATWMNGRTALGAAFVLLAVLAGALFLDCAQRLVPVYAAARDLPAGTPPKSGDLLVVPYDQQNRPFHFIEIIAAGGRIEFSYLYGTPSRRATTDL